MLNQVNLICYAFGMILFQSVEVVLEHECFPKLAPLSKIESKIVSMLIHILRELRHQQQERSSTASDTDQNDWIFITSSVLTI